MHKPIRLIDDLPASCFGSDVIGVDEAGRGPAAGPVVACAFVQIAQHLPTGVADSKLLSETSRGRLAQELIQDGRFAYGISEAFEIDRVNIREATKRAMQRAVAGLLAQMSLTSNLLIAVDGDFVPDFSIPAVAIIKGDARLPVISAASILAKTHRDHLMRLASMRFPGYGFEQHKGYPSSAHKNALAALGPCPVHRQSFATVAAALTSR
jgi:ribonuclease HII